MCIVCFTQITVKCLADTLAQVLALCFDVHVNTTVKLCTLDRPTVSFVWFFLFVVFFYFYFYLIFFFIRYCSSEILFIFLFGIHSVFQFYLACGSRSTFECYRWLDGDENLGNVPNEGVLCRGLKAIEQML